MKTLKFFFLATIAMVFTFTSCQQDEENPFAGIVFMNCDDSGCDTKSCATEVSLDVRIVCSIEGSDDTDWYFVEVSEDDINTNFGVYAFNFINLSENLTFKVDLFTEGVASGDVTVTGNGDLTYEPDDDATGGIQFFEAGTFYFKVERANGQTGDGAYEIILF